jgi:histone H3/H4
MASEFWRVCSSCKRPIEFGASYYVCSVSTCTRPATDYVFCRMPCFATHVPTLRHREAWAEEKSAPERASIARSAVSSTEASSSTDSDGDSPRRRIVAASDHSQPSPEVPRPPISSLPRETLVVASKLKAYVKAAGGMSTSETVLDPLSEAVRALADEAIDNARADGRKTIMSRDIPRR